MCLISKMPFLNCAACICPWGLTGHKMWQHAGTASLLQAPFCTTAAHLTEEFSDSVGCHHSNANFFRQALTLLLRYRCGSPLIKLFLTLQYLRMNKAHACAGASVFTIQQVSVGSVTPKRSWASQKFRWFPSESHPVGLSFGKNLCCLFSTKLALLSLQRIFCSLTMVQSFCCCHHWFGSSKIVPSTVRIDKTQKSGHLVTIFCWGEAMPIPAHL